MIKVPPNFRTRDQYQRSLLVIEKHNLYELAHMKFDEKYNRFFGETVHNLLSVVLSGNEWYDIQDITDIFHVNLNLS